MLNGWAARGCFFFFMLNGWAYACPGQGVQGGCLTYALAYCAAHSGCKLIIFTGPAHSTKIANALQAHAIVKDGEAYTDNMHPRPTRMQGASPIGWCYTIGGGSDWQEWHLFRTIDFDHQTAEDKHVIEVLKRTVR
jgi:hypothetical protein